MAVSCPPILEMVLSNINRVSWVTPDFDDNNEWIFLKPRVMTEWNLFRRLNLRWPRIVPPEEQPNFALTYCHFGQNRGLWLHHLATLQLRADYEPGCHEIYYW